MNFLHEALRYGGDDELLAVATPFLLDGVAAGVPAVVVMDEDSAGLIRKALPHTDGITFLDASVLYASPALAIRYYRELLAEHAAASPGRIRLLGGPGAAAYGAGWDWWARYESTLNHAFDEFPVWSVCTYDARLAPAPVLADVARTHPWRALPGDRRERSTTYAEPRAYLSVNRPLVPDQLQHRPPAAELLDPTPAQARTVVRGLGPGLTPDEQDDLLVAVSEAVTNALRHGRPPVQMRAWSSETRVVITVTDKGDGPTDPFAGLLPTQEDATGGRGLWIAHQTCSHVAYARDPDGWTIRLTAGTL
jgi:anti-sigma regulatory factor (Ser/Thr protein kinase)